MSTDGRPYLGDMPNGPLLPSGAQAAADVGMSVNAFKAHIGNPWPPIRMGKRKLYDWAAIDRACDRRAPPQPDNPGSNSRGS